MIYIDIYLYIYISIYVLIYICVYSHTHIHANTHPNPTHTQVMRQQAKSDGKLHEAKTKVATLEQELLTFQGEALTQRSALDSMQVCENIGLFCKRTP